MTTDLFRRQTMVAGRSGLPVLAHIAECGRCHGTEFLLLIVHEEHADVQRVQCRNCGTSYGEERGGES